MNEIISALEEIKKLHNENIEKLNSVSQTIRDIENTLKETIYLEFQWDIPNTSLSLKWSKCKDNPKVKRLYFKKYVGGETTLKPLIEGNSPERLLHYPFLAQFIILYKKNIKEYWDNLDKVIMGEEE